MKGLHCFLTLGAVSLAASSYGNVSTSDLTTTSDVSSFSESSLRSIDHTTSHGHLGDYIAAGMEMQIETSAIVTSTHTSSPMSGLSIPPTRSERLSNHSTITTTVPNVTSTARYSVSANASSTTSFNATTTGYSDAPGIITVGINYSGDCWQRWNQYWNTSVSVSKFGLDVTKPGSTTFPFQTTAVPLVSVRRDNLTVYEPSCTLPSIVPSCASAWSSFAEGSIRETPACTQVSIDDKACESVRYDYLWNVKNVIQNPYFTNPGYLPNGSWPTKTSLAPGCTLGCAGCAITGNSVELLFWPEQTAAPTTNGTGVHNVTASTPETGPVTAVYGTYTFTSPTIYISYDTLYAANSCSRLGDYYSNTILPLTNSAHLSSLMLTAQNPGLFGAVYTFYVSASFNLSDLAQPIPQSIYDQAPVCQSQSYKNCKVGAGECGFVCATDKPYAPIIAVPVELTELHPEWKECTPWYGGLYDPPIALTKGSTADSITRPAEVKPTTTPAVEGNLPSVTAPAETAQGPTTQVVAKPTPTPESPKPTGHTGPDASDPVEDEPHGHGPEDEDSSSNDPPAAGPSSNPAPDTDSPEDDASGNDSPSNGSPDSGNSGNGQDDGASDDPVESPMATQSSQPDRPGQTDQQTQPNQPHQAASDPQASQSAIFVPTDPSPHGQNSPVNHGSPTNALEVLTQALAAAGSDLGAGVNTQAPRPNITPAPGLAPPQPAAVQLSRSGSDYIVGSNILLPSAATTINGVVVSHNPSSPGEIIVGSLSTIYLAPSQATIISSPAHTIDSLEVSRVDDQNIVVGSHTLAVGQVATVNDLSISVDSAGAIVIAGSSVLSLSDGGQTAIAAMLSSASTALEVHRESGHYVISGDHTLALGQEVEINGLPVSLVSNGNAIVIAGSKTISLDEGASTEIAAMQTLTGQVAQVTNMPGRSTVALLSSALDPSEDETPTGESASSRMTMTGVETDRGGTEVESSPTRVRNEEEPSASTTSGAADLLDRSAVGRLVLVLQFVVVLALLG